MDSGPEPEDMSMPEQGAPLTSNGEIVDEALSRLNGTLRDVCWPVRPAREQLPHAMPDKTRFRLRLFIEVVLIMTPESSA